MNGPTLSYAAPRVLFRGHYAFRSFSNVACSIVLLLVCAMLTALVLDDGRPMWWELGSLANASFVGTILILAGYSLWGLWGLIRNDRIRVEVNEDGIIRGNRFWSWSDVAVFEGRILSGGVRLGFMTQGIMVGDEGFLSTTPLLTEQQYIELAREVDRCLSAQFPHVRVAMSPLPA